MCRYLKCGVWADGWPPDCRSWAYRPPLIWPVRILGCCVIRSPLFWPRQPESWPGSRVSNGKTVRPPKKQIMCSRSFGSPVGDIGGLMEALSVSTGRAAEKLRAQASMTPTIHVFARTSFFRQTPQYSGSAVMPLGEPTDDTRVLLAATRQALRKFFRPGFAYAKAGV